MLATYVALLLLTALPVPCFLKLIRLHWSMMNDRMCAKAEKWMHCLMMTFHLCLLIAWTAVWTMLLLWGA